MTLTQDQLIALVSKAYAIVRTANCAPMSEGPPMAIILEELISQAKESNEN